VPLTVLELYLLAQLRGGTRGRYAMAGALLALTALMCVGIARLSLSQQHVLAIM
jgi:hypothetical protein